MLSIAYEIWRSISHSQACQLREVKVCYRLGVTLKLNYTVLIEVITQYNKIGNDNVICQAPKKTHATLTAHNFWSAWNFHFKFSKEEFQLISLILFQSKYLGEMVKFSKTSLFFLKFLCAYLCLGQLSFNTITHSRHSHTDINHHRWSFHEQTAICSFEFHCIPVFDVAWS